MKTAIDLRKDEVSILGNEPKEPELNLSGHQKAFLFLISLDESVATRIIGHLTGTPPMSTKRLPRPWKGPRSWLRCRPTTGSSCSAVRPISSWRARPNSAS